MEMRENTIRVTIDNNEKRKIIALTGKTGAGLKNIQNFLTSHRNFSKLNRIQALDTNDFLTKIVRGDIIEAECDEHNNVWGTDISNLLTCYIYVGIYTPEQIANMRDSGAVELLPIVIEMPAEARLLHMLRLDCDPNLVKETSDKYVVDTCKEFLQSEKDYYDLQDYLNRDNSLFYFFEDHRDLDMQLKYASFILAIQKFNREKNFITNLDNFI